LRDDARCVDGEVAVRVERDQEQSTWSVSADVGDCQLTQSKSIDQHYSFIR
jgi:hypothetical protein